MIKLRIITPDGVFIDNKECKIINVQTIDGDIGILGEMAPLISALKIGQLNFLAVDEKEPVNVHIRRGILEVTSDLCKIITENAYYVDEE